MRLRKSPQKWTLDLHGRYVEDAVREAEKALEKAVREGIPTLELIHGTSTSSLLHPNRTIKYALYERLDSGAWDRYVASAFRNEGALLLALKR